LKLIEQVHSFQDKSKERNYLLFYKKRMARQAFIIITKVSFYTAMSIPPMAAQKE